MTAKPKILIVDDDSNLRKTLSDILKAKGYLPTDVSTVSQALDKVTELQPVIALIDLKLEDMSGIEVMKGIISSCPSTECIMITGHATQKSAIEAVNVGAYGFVEKPYDMDQLLLMIRRAIEKQVTEEALRESEERYRSLYSHMNEGVCLHEIVYDETGAAIDYRIIDVNPAYESITGLKKEKAVASLASELYGVGEPPFLDVYAKVAETSEPAAFEMFWPPMNKHFHISAFSPAKGKFATVFTDITEQNRAKMTLNESEERFKTLFEFAPDAYYLNDFDGNFIDGNKAAESLSGFKKEELIGKNFFELNLLSPEELPKATDILTKNMEGLAAGPDEVTLNRKDGTQATVEISTCPIDMGGQDIVLGIARDVSERKRLESQLQQSQKMESIGTLAGGIAHDFNNILGIIIGNTELAIMDVPEWNPAKECLKEIRAASMRAKDVVRHILSFARKTPAQRKPIQISTIIRDSLKLMRASIPTTIEIHQNISCESEMIQADPTEINQILMNLCTNSVHALSEETGVLKVNLENEELRMKNEELGLEAGRYVKLTVEDSGEGIDPGIIDRVFDPYFTTKDVGKGTGMGLSVAFGIVKKHDGAMQIKSKLGKGTLVEVFFPLFEEAVEIEVKEDSENLPMGSERVLFVDDEESLTKMVQQMLERLGYEVVTKTNPKEALELFRAEPDKFDLVITDMAMPQMAGDRLAQELMKIRQNIPIILCTGHSARIDKTSAQAMGIRAYTMKPLVMRDLARTIRNVLDNKENS